MLDLSLYNVARGQRRVEEAGAVRTVRVVNGGRHAGPVSDVGNARVDMESHRYRNVVLSLCRVRKVFPSGRVLCRYIGS